MEHDAPAALKNRVLDHQSPRVNRGGAAKAEKEEGWAAVSTKGIPC